MEICNSDFCEEIQLERRTLALDVIQEPGRKLGMGGVSLRSLVQISRVRVSKSQFYLKIYQKKAKSIPREGAFHPYLSPPFPQG